MKVFVTGGSGFIGSRLTPYLLEQGHSVRVFDLKKPKQKAVDFVEGDICCYDDVLSSIKGYDSVIHLAAKTSVAESVEKPAEYYRVNVTGSFNVMKACVDASIKRFVYTSSAAVYGNPAELPLKETSPASPLSPYGASKLAPEFFSAAFTRSYGLEAVVLRLFNVYGPNQTNNDYSGVITKFLERLREGKAPVIQGTGLQSRDFIHIKDVLNAITLAIERPGIGGETFNVASGNPITVEGLANLMISLSGKPLKPTHAPIRPADIMYSYADIEKAKKFLGFVPNISLEEGLKSVLFYR
ncbi:MAG: NAD-dependent epimerase/dehydratase family protein [Candidatus Methanomethylicus sp.]|nr:NAD-dependent epimerase/dehydratase family protein [Candidatus Methanomethylicus sp.]